MCDVLYVVDRIVQVRGFVISAVRLSLKEIREGVRIKHQFNLPHRALDQEVRAGGPHPRRCYHHPPYYRAVLASRWQLPVRLAMRPSRAWHMPFDNAWNHMDKA